MAGNESLRETLQQKRQNLGDTQQEKKRQEMEIAYADFGEKISGFRTEQVNLGKLRHQLELAYTDADKASSVESDRRKVLDRILHEFADVLAVEGIASVEDLAGASEFSDKEEVGSYQAAAVEAHGTAATVQTLEQEVVGEISHKPVATHYTDAQEVILRGVQAKQDVLEQKINGLREQSKEARDFFIHQRHGDMLTKNIGDVDKLDLVNPGDLIDAKALGEHGVDFYSQDLREFCTGTWVDENIKGKIHERGYDVLMSDLEAIGDPKARYDAEVGVVRNDIIQAEHDLERAVHELVKTDKNAVFALQSILHTGETAESQEMAKRYVDYIKKHLTETSPDYKTYLEADATMTSFPAAGNFRPAEIGIRPDSEQPRKTDLYDPAYIRQIAEKYRTYFQDLATKARSGKNIPTPEDAAPPPEPVAWAGKPTIEIDMETADQLANGIYRDERLAQTKKNITSEVERIKQSFEQVRPVVGAKFDVDLTQLKVEQFGQDNPSVKLQYDRMNEARDAAAKSLHEIRATRANLKDKINAEVTVTGPTGDAFFTTEASKEWGGNNRIISELQRNIDKLARVIKEKEDEEPGFGRKKKHEKELGELYNQQQGYREDIQQHETVNTELKREMEEIDAPLRKVFHDNAWYQFANQTMTVGKLLDSFTDKVRDSKELTPNPHYADQLAEYETLLHGKRKAGNTYRTLKEHPRGS